MNRKIHLICTVLAAAPLALSAGPALAQESQGSVADFKLSPGEPTTPARAQGPVDVDAPIRVPEPSPTPPPPPPTIAIPVPTASPTAGGPAARPTGTAAPANRPAPSAPTAPARPEALPLPTATASARPDIAYPAPGITPTLPAGKASQPSPDEQSQIPAWAWLAAAATLLSAGAWLLIRRRGAKPPVRVELAPRPSPRPEPTPEPRPLPSPAPAPLASATGGVTLQLTPRSLNSSLFMATLRYRIEVENTGTEVLGPITISGDMIAAHSSLSPQEQLGAVGQNLAEMHRIEGLQPGQRTELTGEIRLPHSSIKPIRQGKALLFIPLVRVYALDAVAGSVVGGGTFVIGEPPPTSGGRLRPFRLDLGPRNYPALEHRKLAMPDAMPLDGRAMAG